MQIGLAQWPPPHNWAIVFLTRGCKGVGERNLKTKQINVGWLLGRKGRRKQERGRSYGGLQERETLGRRK